MLNAQNETVMTNLHQVFLMFSINEVTIQVQIKSLHLLSETHLSSKKLSPAMLCSASNVWNLTSCVLYFISWYSSSSQTY